MNGARCDNCGLVIFADATACKRCGLRLHRIGETPQAGLSCGVWDPGSYGTVYQGQEPPNGSPVCEPVERKHGLRAIALTVLLVAVIATSIGYALFPRQKPNEINWSEYKSREGRYAVMMPAEPTESVREQSSAAGILRSHLALADFKERGFCMVLYVDFPVGDLEGYEDEILEIAMEGLVTSTKSLLNSKRQIKIWGNRGIECEATPPRNKFPRGGRFICRMCWVRQRLYMIAIGAPESERLMADRETFLYSFKPG